MNEAREYFTGVLNEAKRLDAGALKRMGAKLRRMIRVAPGTGLRIDISKKSGPRVKRMAGWPEPIVHARFTADLDIGVHIGPNAKKAAKASWGYPNISWTINREGLVSNYDLADDYTYYREKRMTLRDVAKEVQRVIDLAVKHKEDAMRDRSHERFD